MPAPGKLITDQNLINKLENNNQQSYSQEISDSDLISKLNNSPTVRNENKAISAVKAPFRIAGDVIGSGIDFIKKTPDYLRAAKTEIPGAFDLAISDPKRAGKQFLSGLGELGQGVLNSPFAIADYATNRLNLLPQGARNALYDYAKPVDFSKDFNAFAGNIEKEGDAFLRGLGRNALLVPGATSTLKAINPMRYRPEAILNRAERTAERMERQYGRKYENNFARADRLNLGQTLPQVRNNINFNDILRGEPANAQTALTRFMQNPTTRNAHAFKSDLLRIQRRLKKNHATTGLSDADTLKYNAVNHAINELESNMFTDAAGNVHRKTANQYRRIQEGFENDVLPYRQNKGLQKYIAGDLKADEALPYLSKGKFRARQGSSHPEIERINKMQKYAPWLVAGGGFGAGASLLGWLLSDKK